VRGSVNLAVHASGFQVPALALGVAINAMILYVLLGGRFRVPGA
jgi:hypothetical protein